MNSEERHVEDDHKLADSKTSAKDSQSRADELQDRLIHFGVRVIKLSSALPKTPAGKHVSGQILRSGTSPAPNYGEARGAESHADFVHKLGVVLKELNETAIWLQMIEQSELLKRERWSASWLKIASFVGSSLHR